MKSISQSYHSYLLRLWHDPKTNSWRIIVEDVHSGQKQGFVEIESLFTYIKKQSQENE